MEERLCVLAPSFRWHALSLSKDTVSLKTLPSSLCYKCGIVSLFVFWHLSHLSLSPPSFSYQGNYYLYHDIISGKFELIQWDDEESFVIGEFNASLYGFARMDIMAQRTLYCPEWRAQYLATLGEFLSKVFIIDELIAYVSCCEFVCVSGCSRYLPLCVVLGWRLGYVAAHAPGWHISRLSAII